MEILIQEQKSFVLRESIQNYTFELPNRNYDNSSARRTHLPPIQVTQELLDGLHTAGLTPKAKPGQSIAGFVVSVGFRGTTGPGLLHGYIQLIGDCGFLLSLLGGKSHWLEKVKVKLEVEKIVCETTTRLFTRDSHLILPTAEYRSHFFHPWQCEAKRIKVITTMGNDWSDPWNSPSEGGTWNIVLSIKLLLPRFVGAGSANPEPIVQDFLAANRRMLTNDILAYTKVIAQNDAEIKFHRSFLAAHSLAFERMFRTKMQEAASGVLELPDMTEEGVRALKEYLYVWELKAAQENSLVCFELFEAGHKYGISTLEQATAQILLQMDGAWYSAVVALRLFLLVKDMELPLVKQKAVEVLKLKREEVMTLEQFHDLFKKENIAVAKELTECLLASP